MWSGTANLGGGRSPQASAGPPETQGSRRKQTKTSPDYKSPNHPIPQFKKKGASPAGRPFLFKLVEPGGFEPPSVSPLPLDLHV